MHNIAPSVAPLVEGRLLTSESDATVAVINPSNGQRCFSIPAGCRADVDRAVTSARGAFEDGRWSEAPPSFRKRILYCLADLMESAAAELDAWDAGEMGKPVSVSLCNTAAAAGLVRFYAEAVDKVMGDAFVSDKNSFVVQRRVPRGVVAAIVPWNFPTFNAAVKVAPALAAGNSVVLKPSEWSSRSAMRIAQLASQAGLPPGVLNVVPGLGETVGRELAVHADVDMVSFTGSIEVGKLMLQYAGQSNMKLVHSECGGKSPQIVFDDGIDLDAVSAAIAGFLLTNQGQICTVGSRLLVERSIESAMVQKIVTHFERIVMGDALDPKTTFGPLASERQLARVMEHVAIAKAQGAELVAGGRRALHDSGGYFVEPTLFRAVPANTRLAREEIFGPVLSVQSFRDEAEALRLANDTLYGLSAYVWTTSLSRGLRMARGIRSEVLVNAAVPSGEGAGYAVSSEPMRQSGLGVDGGLAGMESYLRRQLVGINHA